MPKRLLSLTILTALAVSACAETPAPQQQAATQAPPPFPVYVMRAEVKDGNRLDSSASGKNLFSNRCGSCHLDFGMGTNVLTARRAAMGLPPQTGLLENRTDLSAAYVKTVVRYGQGGMPRITRVDVTDSELELIAAYLEGNK